MEANQNVMETFNSLMGLRAWGLVRTHGSMFFLEIGEPIQRRTEKKQHGKWHFLVEMCDWTIEATYTKKKLVTSKDSPAFIDRVFRETDLGFIDNARLVPQSNSLRVAFSCGLTLRTSPIDFFPDDHWKQWQLYGPGDYVWAIDEKGKLLHVKVYG